MAFGDRKAGLRRNTPAAREFGQRGRVSGAKSLRESAQRAARAPRPVEGPLSPRAWRERAFESSGGACIVTGARAAHAFDRRFHVHHFVAAEALRDRGLHAHVWDPRNAGWVERQVHLDHEWSPRSPITLDLVPESAWQFAQEMDALDGTEWATVHVERFHPAAGSSGSTTRRRS
jgi:hypothetical protein